MPSFGKPIQKAPHHSYRQCHSSEVYLRDIFINTRTVLVLDTNTHTRGLAFDATPTDPSEKD